MLKILELRDHAADELGEDFDLKEFHTLVLQNGSIPWEILEHVNEAYITSRKWGSNTAAFREVPNCWTIKCYDEG